MSSTLHTSIETITPEIAAEMLQKNDANRHIIKGHVQTLAGAITAGDYVLNGEAIIFNGDGTLLDGQHRLYAVIEAGKPIESLVVRGVSRSVFATMDQGRRRSAADVFGINKEQNKTVLASSARAFELFRRRQPGTFRKEKDYVSVKELLAVVDAHPGLRQSAAYVDGHKRTRNLITAGICAWLHYEFTRREPAKAEAFFDILERGENVGLGHPVFHLRERLIDNKVNTAKLSEKHISNLVIKAWNAYQAGRSLRQLRLVEREPFPDIEPALPD